MKGTKNKGGKILVREKGIGIEINKERIATGVHRLIPSSIIPFDVNSSKMHRMHFASLLFRRLIN